MNATKRKFNALLQGLSNQQPSKLPDKPASSSQASDDLLKRRRVGIASTKPALSSNQSSPSKPITGASVTTQRDNVIRLPLAKYCPADRDELLRRLATFQEITDWTPKPDRINEVEWAKKGWVCQGKERVRGMLCSRELVVQLRRKGRPEGDEASLKLPAETEDALVEKYVELMVTSHRDDCLWRKQGCDDHLLRISFTNTKKILEALRQRYDELCARQPFLPYEFNLRLPESLKADEILALLPKDFFTDPPQSSSASLPAGPPNRVALLLAVMGWQGLTNPRIGSVPNSASCHTCLRRLGLWMFKSKEVDENGAVLVPAPMDHLDPIWEHRFFCPWRNDQVQGRALQKPGQGAPLAGWNALVQALRNDAHLRSVYEGRSPAKSHLNKLETRSTHSKNPSEHDLTPVNSIGSTAFTTLEKDDDEDDEKEREAKDKERWARLRRVKSLFDSKGVKKLRRLPHQTSVDETRHSVDSAAGR